MNNCDIAELNLLKCREAMALLYQTYITDSTQAAYRGVAITVLDRLLLSIQESTDPNNMVSAIDSFEAVPWSKRMRESGDPQLAEIAKTTTMRLFDDAPPLYPDEQG